MAEEHVQTGNGGSEVEEIREAVKGAVQIIREIKEGLLASMRDCQPA
ncbi:hypothetical protein [Hyperthermus butylicus]|nr:hypothetical protein [Hyperthermus butylicus]